MEQQVSVSRRGFVTAMCAAGAASAVGSVLTAEAESALAADSAFPVAKRGKPVEAKIDADTGALTINEDVIVRYSGCLGCYSSCGNRVKLDRATGKIFSVAGNPYHPSCAYPFLDRDESLETAYRTFGFANDESKASRGTICGRGQATLDAYFQPDRVTVPLKRAGKRGEGKWKAIGWDQLIKEVTEGGQLFAELGETQNIEGLKAIHDTQTPLDPARPGLGPKSCQLVCLGGRGDGRGTGSRFPGAFGSINNYGHGAS